MTESNTQSVFITGGASGLGKAIAQRYAKAGFCVAIGDIDKQASTETVARLHELGAADAIAIQCDVTDENSLYAAAETLKSAWPSLDIVINNAGIAAAGRVEEFSLDDWRHVMEVNLIGVAASCKVFTPLFRQQGYGHFVNIASLVGIVSPPFMSAYVASKAAVIALSESLRLELEADNIVVSVACPSYFPTDMSIRMRSTQANLVTAMNQFMQASELTADDVAGDIYDGACGAEFLILPHAIGKQAVGLKRILPDALWFKYMLRKTAKLVKMAA